MTARAAAGATARATAPVAGLVTALALLALAFGPVAAAAQEEGAADTLEDDGYPGGPVYVTDLDSLRKLGPVYTPYDRSPVLRPGEWLENLLGDTLVPVIERHDIPADESARLWVLVDRNGRVADVVLHLTSGHEAFDRAARAAAQFLRYQPARRDGEWVPVWVLTPISLLMR